MQEQITKRMMRVGVKKNLNNLHHSYEMEQNKELVKVEKKSDGGIENIDLILEPDKFDELSSKTRLTLEEYINAINEFIEGEEDDWESLRLKDQINMTRDQIVAAIIIKYAKEELKLNLDNMNGTDISYNKRFGKNGEYLGEAIIVSLTRLSGFNVVSQ